MIRTLTMFCFRAVLLAGFTACLPAQTSSVLRGEIRDSSGLAVQGSQVRVTNSATGLERVVRSNEFGIYAAPELPIGRYRIEVESTGFKKAVRDDVELNVGQTVRADFALELGQVTESITVQSAAPLVATESTSLGNLRHGQQIQSMPLNARGISGLFSLTAGVPVFGNGVNPVSTGYVDTQGVGTTAFMIDGTVGNSPINGNSGNVPSLNGRVIEQDTPNLETVAEFRFITSNSNAEYGQVTSVTVATKSGTNELHGSLFAYNRVGATSARSFFAPARENLTRNQYGVSAGGPVWIPQLYNGRNRTFFFGAFEGFRDHRQFPVTGKFPNSKERAGDLSVLSPVIQLRDPNGGIFPNNVIPPSRIHPVSRALLEYVPIPDGDQSAAVAAAFNFAGAKPQIDHTDKGDAKIDHRFSNSNSFSGRLTYSDNFNHWTNSSPLPNEFGLGLQDTYATQVSMSDTHLVSPSQLSELRFGYWRKRRFVRLGYSDLDFLSGPTAIPGIHPSSPFAGPPSVSINSSLLGVTPTMFTASTTVRRAAEETLQIAENYSLHAGRHSFKFGLDVRRLRINNYSAANPAGSFTFSSSAAVANSATGDSFADFLLGLPQTDAWAVPKDGYSRAWQYFAFAQDDYKVTSRLTLNLGLRWEYLGKLGEKYGRDANYDASVRKVVIPSQGRQAMLAQFEGDPLIVLAETVGLGSRLIEPDLNNFGPRFGVAWQPFDTAATVIRAAYGIYYTQPSGFLNFQTAQGPPYNTAFAFSRPVAIGANGRPPSFDNPVATGGASGNLLAPVNSVDRRYRDVYSQVWNFTIERQLWRNASARGSYLGNKGSRIPRQMFSNACMVGLVACESRTADQFPRADVNFPVTVGGMQTVGKSIYHGFQTELEQRYSGGFFLNANYTFGRVIGLSTSPADPLGNASLERGPDTTSIAHIFHFNSVWDLPFGPGRRFGPDKGVIAAIVGGWQLAGLLHVQSGQPFTVTAPAPDTGTGSTVNRADRVADGRLSMDRPKNDWLNQFFDTTAFRRPARGTVGTSGVGVLIGPGLFNSDVTVMKNFDITEQVKLRFRAEFFNVFNHANFSNPVADVTSSAFGRISSTYGFPRQIQFGLRLQF